MLIYLVRHGETDANLEGRLQGWSDDPLNESGRRLAKITGGRLRGIRFDGCISSPLIRAKETAEIILRESGNDTEIITDARIREIHAGEWERKKYRPGECEIDPQEIKTFFTDPFRFSGCPGGEDTARVCERTQAFLRELLAKDDGKTYLVTTHGFSLRAMLNFLYDDPKDFWHGHVPYNLAVNIVEGTAGTGKLIADDRIYYDPKDAVDRFAKF